MLLQCMLWLLLYCTLLQGADGGMPCMSFNTGAAAAAEEGVIDVFTCPADDISLTHCMDPVPLRNGPAIRLRPVTWTDVLIVVDFSSSMKTDALLWWVQMVTEPLTVALINKPCAVPSSDSSNDTVQQSNDCDLSILQLKKQLLHTRRHLRIEIIQPPLTDDLTSIGSERTYRLLYGLLVASQLAYGKKYIFKLDPDSILFPRRFFDFLSTLTSVVPTPLEPLYFGTLRKEGVTVSVNSSNDEGRRSDLSCEVSRFTGQPLCRADDGSGFGLNMLALLVVEPVLRSILRLPPMPPRYSPDAVVMPLEIKYPIESVGEVIAAALSAYDSNRSRTDESRHRNSVMHCGSFGASDLISEESGLHQTISFHYVQSEWLTLNKHHLMKHYDDKYKGVMTTIRDMNVEMNLMTELNPLHADFVPAKGDEYGLKVLIVSSDNRRLSRSLSSGEYYSAAAVLQYHYCLQHNYDYLRIRLDGSNVLQEVSLRDPSLLEFLRENELLLQVVQGELVYHPAYKYFRRPSWGKLLALWHAISEIGHRYDYVWFLDSDVAPNTFEAAVSLGKRMRMWAEKPPDRQVIAGKQNISAAHFIFLSNFPWRDDLPCAGSIMIRPSNRTLQAVQEWWDYDLPQKNIGDFLEQDALWYMLEADKKYHFPLSWKSVSLVNERQFPSEYDGVADLWMVHLINYERNRVAYMLNLLRPLGYYDQKVFARKVFLIESRSTFHLDVMEVADRMELARAVSLRLHSDYPPVLNIEHDGIWHLPRDRGARPPVDAESVGRLFNGFAIQRDYDGTIYLVYQGKKYDFPNMETFEQKFGFTNDLVLRFYKYKDKEKALAPHLDIRNIKYGGGLPTLRHKFIIAKNFTIEV